MEGAGGSCRPGLIHQTRDFMSDNSTWHGTTILCVRKGGDVVVAGDGQVTLGQTVIKANARKVRRIGDGSVIGGFAGATADAFHISAPEPTGRGAAASMTKAIKDGGAQVTDISYIVAHGTSTPLNDLTETKAIKRALGDHAYKIPISSPKSMVGHLLGGAGAVAGLAAIKAIETGTVPPTINLETPDPDCDLDYVPNTARTNQPVDRVLINGFGFGGQNASALFGKLRG